MLDEPCLSPLSEPEIYEVIETGKKLLLKQSTKECEDDIACLPSLKIEDISTTAPVFKVQDFWPDVPSFKFKGQISAQPTNGVSFFRAMIDTKDIQNEPYYHWFVGLLTSMGAGEKYNFRDLETTIDLYTGGLSSAHQLSENYSDLTDLNQGLLISSRCLERNSKIMFELWSDVFNHAFSNLEDNEELKARLGKLFCYLLCLTTV